VLSGINSAIVHLRERQTLFEEACRIAVEDGGFCSAWAALLDAKDGRLVTRANAGLPLPVHALKIDRSFVVGMTQNEHSLAIVRSIISLARSLGLRVIAEGVETEAQAGLLQRLECDEMQGYLVSRPLPPAEVVEFLAGWGASGG
jgi:EAL domain-containing protein (putative c-di-GMP-specific phosphodiesterase class I)